MLSMRLGLSDSTIFDWKAQKGMKADDGKEYGSIWGG